MSGPHNSEVHAALQALIKQLEGHPAWGRLVAQEDSALRGVPVPLLAVPHVASWYLAGAPENLRVPWTVERLKLYAPGDVSHRQVGYRTVAGQGDAPAPGWDPRWWVVGDFGGDPLIVTAPDGAVLVAAHGLGQWSPLQVAEDVAELLQVVAAWLRVWNRTSGDIRDSNGDLRDDVRTAFKNELAGILRPPHAANLMQFVG